MREILFKYVIKNIHTGVLYSKIYSLNQIEENGLKSLFDVENYEIISKLQFTGLHDKNGTRIFEGDVLKVDDNWDEYGFMAGEKRAVIFSYGGFRFKPENEKYKGHWLEDDKEFEVIGNIHENK